MKGRPVDSLVYEQMFPKPRPQDPQNFHALLQRHLILEVRQEVHSFYGHLDTPEAKYPGLDYNNPVHRVRLSRWQWHRRLFRAFDGLGLTANEIAGLTKWEGTKWAKERYEREQNCVIHDTAADDLPRWVEPEGRGTPAQDPPEEDAQEDTQEDVDDAMEEVEEEDEDSEGELESVGVALNEQLRERVAARYRGGDVSIPLDEAWEQWFKNAVETGEITIMRERVMQDPPSALFPPRMLEAARAGNWHEIPEPLQDMIRDALRAEENRLRGRAPVSTTPSSTSSPSATSQVGSMLLAPVPSISHSNPGTSTRSSYSGLRIPGAFQGVDDGGTSRAQRSNA